MINIVVLGSGGHAKVILDSAARSGQFRIIGLLDRERAIGERVMNHEVIGRDADLPRLVEQGHVQGAVVAVGDNALRAKIAGAAKELVPNLTFPNVIHPAAQIADGVAWGEGNVVMAGAVVNSGATIGDFCILNTLCSIDHDCRLGSFVSFAPHACAGGNVHVGAQAAICLGARIIHQVRVGGHTVVGAGATVLSDLPDAVVAYGTPARIVRPRRPGDKYL